MDKKPHGVFAGIAALAALACAPALAADAVQENAVAALDTANIYAFGAPIVHWSHGNTATGFASLALRIALPVGGAFVGRAQATCTREGMFGNLLCGTGEAVVGGLVGMLLASAIDASLLAWESSAEEATGREARIGAESPKTFLAVDVRRGTVGLGGRF